MYYRPKTLTAACALSLIGAVVAIVAAFMTFDVTAADVFDMALGVVTVLLVAVLFLAIAGSMGRNAQWSWNVTMVMIFINAAIVIIAYFYFGMDVIAAVALLAIALIVAALTAASGDRWINKQSMKF